MIVGVAIKTMGSSFELSIFCSILLYKVYEIDMGTIKTWAAVNKNGFLLLFTNEPTRNDNTGKWEGELYVNSAIHKMLGPLVEQANMSWENDPEYFEFEIK